MKKVAYLFLLTCCSAFVSCSEGIETNDSSPEVKSVTRIVASIDSPIDDQPSTRMNFIESNGTFTWAISDTIGIFPNTGDQVSFPIEEGMENLTTVDFNGGGWDLKADATYYAYFPFNRNNFWGYDAKYALKISFLGQKQNGKDNADFAATYPFASFGVNNNGNVHFRFKQIASLAQFSITAPNPATFVKAILTTEDGGNYFVQEGTFNLMETTLDEPPTISGKSYGPTIEMALENISTTSENETFIGAPGFFRGNPHRPA